MRILRERIESDEAKQTYRSTLVEAARKLAVELLVSALRTVWVVTVAGAAIITGVPLAVDAAKAAPAWAVPPEVVERLDAIVGTMAILHDAAAKYLAST